MRQICAKSISILAFIREGTALSRDFNTISKDFGSFDTQWPGDPELC